MKKQLHLFVSGMVQGVGFRYYTQRVASRMGLGGWVRNLYDGRVEIVAEGEEEVLKNFLAEIKGGMMKSCIRGIEEKWSDYQEEFTEFRIRF